MTVQKPRILVVGDICVEQIVKVDSLPERGGSCEAEGYECVPGGKGMVNAVAMSRLGGDSVLCSAVGDDTYGSDLDEYLKAERVDSRFAVRKRGESTAIDLVLTSDDGERRVYCRAALDKMNESDVEEACISYPDGAVLHGRLPAQVIDAAVKHTCAQETPLFILSLPDPSKYPVSKLGQCEILVVDSDEAFRCTGIRPADQERCMRACIALTQVVKAKYVIIRLEERGSFLFDGKYYNFFASLDVPDVDGVSSNDAFSAALVVEYLRSEGDIKRACDYATVVSALYMTRGGGLRALPRHEDVKRFAIRNGIDLDFD